LQYFKNEFKIFLKVANQRERIVSVTREYFNCNNLISLKKRSLKKLFLKKLSLKKLYLVVYDFLNVPCGSSFSGP
jgi:hypothetical protein